MQDENNARPANVHHVTARGPQVVVAVFAVATVAVLTLVWNAIAYRLQGSLNPYFFVLSLFLSINLLICFWEICLYLRRYYVEERARYWRDRHVSTGRTPAVEFLTSTVPMRHIASPTLWADTWATYAQYDGAYTDRRSFGFNADIGNGFVTPIPSMLLLAALTFEIMPATFTGIIGVALFWQWVYVSSLYAVSVWVSRQHEALSRPTRWIYVWGPNAVWIVVPLLGLFVSLRLILDGSYAVVGH